MIRACEHVYPRDVQGGENALCYTTFYGGERFSDLSDHPVITGELEPVKLSDAMCRAAGLGPGCVTTAAGGYQLIKPTWERLKKAKGAMQPLWDFSPASQDEAAVRLLDEIGATKLIQAGRIEDAIKVASKVWASLPGSTAQQNPKKLQYALDRFAEGLVMYEGDPGLEL
ncbi:MAG: endolysin [Betaproteobacteria bacterium]|nr:endolysin [Betaproteobacteria bacterium]